MSEKKSHGCGILAVILATIVIASFWTFILYADIEKETGSSYISASDYPAIDTVVFENRLPIFNTKVRFVEVDSPYLFTADWEYYYTYFEEMTDIPKIKVTNTTEGNVIKIILDIENQDEDHMNWGLFESNVSIQINKKYAINFTSMMSTGSLDVAGDTINFNSFNVDQSTGSVDISLANTNIGASTTITATTGSVYAYLQNVKIVGDLSLISSTGSQDLYLKQVSLTKNLYIQASTGSVDIVFEDISFSENAYVTIDSSTGSINGKWTQTKTIGKNVEMNLDCSTGSINMDYSIPLSLIRYEITASAETGSVNILENSNPQSTPYRSSNYETSTLDLMKINAHASTGSVNLSVLI